MSRLCEPIDGIDAVHIATCLGLDSANFKSKSTTSASSSLQINPTLSKQQQKLQAYINEIERYKNCVPFKFNCPACKTENVWKEVFIKNEVLKVKSFKKLIILFCVLLRKHQKLSVF